MDKNRAFPVEFVCVSVESLALREQGIVYCDGKTSNVRIADSPSGARRAVIIDFGPERQH